MFNREPRSRSEEPLVERGTELDEGPPEAEGQGEPENHAADLEGVPIDDPISLYLSEMARIPLLRPEEEVCLAQRIERGRQAQCDLPHLPARCSPHKRRELEHQVEDGLRARESLIRANTRLVVSVARRYQGRGLPLLDLIQEGNLGLMRAVEKYDYTRGFRFSTYATWWIRQGVSRAVAEQSRTIRIPAHLHDRLRRIHQASVEMEQDLGRAPNVVELAERLQLETTVVEWMLQVSQPPLSLESTRSEDDDTELGVLLEDKGSSSPFQATFENMLHERVEEVLATLSPREARVLRLRFGLGEDRPYTLEEVGQKFGLTRERIRQIEGQALRRLRQPLRARLLREYAA